MYINVFEGFESQLTINCNVIYYSVN